jgi:hypothetical protein
LPLPTHPTKIVAFQKTKKSKSKYSDNDSNKRTAAITSQRMMPPKMFTNIARTCVSLLIDLRQKKKQNGKSSYVRIGCEDFNGVLHLCRSEQKQTKKKKATKQLRKKKKKKKKTRESRFHT